ncbi:MAG: phage major capsid protein [Streptosporangiaceae bacterium]
MWFGVLGPLLAGSVAFRHAIRSPSATGVRARSTRGSAAARSLNSRTYITRPSRANRRLRRPGTRCRRAAGRPAASSAQAPLYCGPLLTSLQLIQDSAFNIDQFVADSFGEAIGREIAALAISGTGSGQPLGIITALAARGQVSTSGGYYQLGTGYRHRR